MKKSRCAASVFLFFLSFFLLCASGRLDSIDPLAQLQAATALARTGRLSRAEHPMPEVPNLWNRGVNGAFYEAHDLGGTIFLLPAAWAGSFWSHRPVDQQIVRPTWPARFAAAFSYTALASVGCFFLFRFFAGLYAAPRTGFLLALAFATTTIFWAYAKSAYDVLGACVGVCALLAFSGRALSAAGRRVSGGEGAKIGAAFAVAGAFRFSLAPFLGAGVLGVLYLLWKRGERRAVGICVAVMALGLAPSVLYNYARTAAPLRTGAVGPHSPAYLLHGSIPQGLYGLLLSPNRGLLFFAPIFLVLLALPWVWKAVPPPGRQILVCYGLTAITYTAAVAHLQRWNAIGGWGPRYLVPVLPILFVGVGVVLVAGWRRHRRILGLLLAASALLNAVPVLVDHGRASRDDVAATSDTAVYPRQQAAAWAGLARGLRGDAPPVPAEAAPDPVRRLRSAFPDLWTVRLMRHSPAGAAAGGSAALLLLLLAARSLRAVLRCTPEKYQVRGTGAWGQ